MSNSFPLPQRVDTRRRRRRRTNEVTNSTSETENNINLKAGDDDKKSNTLITNIPGGSSYHAPQFEYTNDHPADVQLHAWGENLIESFEQVAVALFAYETTLDNVELRNEYKIDAKGHDILSLCYNYLNEFLYLFSGEGVVCSHIRIVNLDLQAFKIEALGYGEPFHVKKHAPVGTEVKAITYSHMQIYSNHELLQTGVDNNTEEKSVQMQKNVPDKKHGGQLKHPSEIYVIVDI
jgi:SHS2 domain-containing protein